MLNRYGNFVRPSSRVELRDSVQPLLSGEEAKRIYLEEIQKAGHPINSKRLTRSVNRIQNTKKKVESRDISKKDLFLSVQNDDVQTLVHILETCPNLLNTTDEFGWSLLMIACQANSINAAKELLRRGIDTSVRDKAGNSAQSLVIKNRNFVLADILLSYKSNETVRVHQNIENTIRESKSKVKQEYLCETCNREFPDKDEHLSSTVHNITASKGKKVPVSYVIPASNKGYQLMLKEGWDKESGLGPDGSGMKYPIKTVQKKDRKGLGLDKKRRKLQEERKETEKRTNRKSLHADCKSSAYMEINFRRQFY